MEGGRSQDPVQCLPEHGCGGSKQGQNICPPTATHEVRYARDILWWSLAASLSYPAERTNSAGHLPLAAVEDCPQDVIDLSQHQLYVLLLRQVGQHTQAGDQVILSTILIKKLHLWYCCLSQLSWYETIVERLRDFPLLVEQLYNLPPGPVRLILHLYQEQGTQKLARMVS